MWRWLIIFFVMPLSIEAGSLDRIRKALEKFEWEKASELIEKARNKEPGNPGLDFFSAQDQSTPSL